MCFLSKKTESVFVNNAGPIFLPNAYPTVSPKIAAIHALPKRIGNDTYPWIERNPAVNKRVSPGKKKPKNNPVSAKIIKTIPINPTVFIIKIGSNIYIYLTLLPTPTSTSGVRKTGRPSRPSTAISMPLLSKPLIFLGSKFTMYKTCFPTRLL